MRQVFKQVCIYAFNYNELKFLGLLQEKVFRKIEDIELMRYLELTSKKIKMIEVSDGSLSVDIKSDIKKVENFLKRKKIKNEKNLN